ncbi:hypothetical protein DUNSADRAFT_11803 [Dunaliella salina]|uniref:Encoded protein n=1 Tax=Dunaliella salina TaxID=3046 RepID=A0ABQ7GCJ0_DUNSA|nr:hypothetical protein DUNSADRAFT_11803 [Dunaliella salina]|eukprot:KAF5832327.1 hypothetical protein DUNSADRAFT_11803 [Dunaliella salina]
MVYVLADYYVCGMLSSSHSLVYFMFLCASQYRGDVARAREQSMSKGLAGAEAEVSPVSSTSLPRRLEGMAAAVRTRAGAAASAGAGAGQACSVAARHLLAGVLSRCEAVAEARLNPNRHATFDVGEKIRKENWRRWRKLSLHHRVRKRRRTGSMGTNPGPCIEPWLWSLGEALQASSISQNGVL